MSTTGNLQSPEIANSRVSGNNGAAHALRPDLYATGREEV
jgi:hypothetical protein